MGEQPGRPPGAADVAGAAQARRQPQPRQHGLPVHEPDPREDRRQLRLPGDPAGRPGAQVLLLAAARHPPDRDPQGGHRGGRQPGPRQGRQEQGRGAVPPGRVRHRVRRRHLARGLPARPRRSSTTWSRSRARSSPTASCGSARAATTPSSSWPRTRSWRSEIEGKIFAALGIDAQRRARSRRCRTRPRPTPRPRRRRQPRPSPRRRRPSARRRAVAVDERSRGRPSSSRARGALSRKERTVAELARVAAGADFDADDVEEALERLIAIGELDDERFAARYAEDKRELRGWGPERIREALSSAGIDRDAGRGAPRRGATTSSRAGGRRCSSARGRPRRRAGARRGRSPSWPARLRAPRSPTRRCAAPSGRAERRLSRPGARATPLGPGVRWIEGAADRRVKPIDRCLRIRTTEPATASNPRERRPPGAEVPRDSWARGSGRLAAADASSASRSR